ncbi:MAG: DUF2281 domain-containing protein [Moorea sp. SIO1F2]|uniref:hypothetical protein n=1 Tax=unclassified Moorena TaxID=2683338 RepID=UPI0013BE6F3F|nr:MULTISPECIES: hypothetical protein [unclassified Moorena]NEO21170.1 DUF2281 domain-containing protein [Moorena sp. SIO4A5]NET83648.1 DUF2281 domain-containing protein [Moorena sp. SIO1F2]
MGTSKSPPMVIPHDVLAVLQVLSPKQRQLVFDFAEFLLQKQRKSEIEKSADSPPIPG